jgi:hypothetical protein
VGVTGTPALDEFTGQGRQSEAAIQRDRPGRVPRASRGPPRRSTVTEAARRRTVALSLRSRRRSAIEASNGQAVEVSPAHPARVSRPAAGRLQSGSGSVGSGRSPG